MKNKYRFKLIRHWGDHNQTTCTLLVVDETGQPRWGSFAIERGDRNNERNVSRVPAGIYPIVWEMSPRFNEHLWELKNVPNRSECKIHPSNYWNQINGCIAPGARLKKLNSDDYQDVTSSRNTVDSLHRFTKGMTETTIEIIDEPVTN